MIDLWPQWLRPLWLLVIPLLGWLLFKLWHRRKRAGRWQMILPPQFHAVLLGGGSGSTSKLPWVALGLAWLLIVLALLGPSWQRLEETRQRPADPLVILLELTPQMLAEDSAPNRLEQARRKILDLLEHRQDSQTALIVYAGSAHTLVPLSDDLGTTRNLLEAIDPSIMPQPGQRADLAVQKGLALLAQSGLGQGRLLLVGSSLSNPEREGISQVLGRQGPSLLMLGVGSAEGAPVRQANGEYLKDDQGGILLPRLDSASLKGFINGTGGRYRHARIDDLDLRGLGLFDNPRLLRNDGQTVQLDSWADQGYWLLLPLLLLAACAGRRGWLFCLPLLLALPQPSQAFEFNDLWLRPDQQGQHLLERQQPAEAARHFEDSQWRGAGCTKPVTSKAPPPLLPKATRRPPTTIEAMPWPGPANWKRRWTPTNRRWSASPTSNPPWTTRRWSSNCCSNSRPKPRNNRPTPMNKAPRMPTVKATAARPAARPRAHRAATSRPRPSNPARTTATPRRPRHGRWRRRQHHAAAPTAAVQQPRRRTAPGPGTMAAGDSRQPGGAAAAQILVRTAIASGTLTMSRFGVFSSACSGAFWPRPPPCCKPASTAHAWRPAKPSS